MLQGIAAGPIGVGGERGALTGPPPDGRLSLAGHRVLSLSSDRVAVLADGSTGWCILPARAYPVLADFFDASARRRLADADATSSRLLARLWSAGLLLVDGSPPAHTRAAQPRHPNALLLKLTGSCNIACTYCYDYDPQRWRARLDDDRVLDVVTSLMRENDHLSIAFHGGEPLLRFDQIQRVVRQAKELAAAESCHLSFSVQTNGLFFTDGVVDYLQAEHFSVGISLDAATEEGNALRLARRGPTPLQAVQRLLRDRPEFVRECCGFLAVASKTSAPYLPGLVLWLQDAGVTGLAISFLDRTGRAAGLTDEQLSPDAAVNLFKEFVRLIGLGEIDGLALHPLLTRIRNLFTFQPRDLCAKGPCGAAGEFVVLDAEGAVRSCDCIYDPFFELAGPNEPVPDSGHRKRLAVVDRRANLRLQGSCGHCPLFGLCGGTCVAKAIAEHGSPDSVSSVECALSKYLYPLLLEEAAAPDEDRPLLRYYLRHDEVGPAGIVQTCLT